MEDGSNQICDISEQVWQLLTKDKPSGIKWIRGEEDESTRTIYHVPTKTHFIAQGLDVWKNPTIDLLDKAIEQWNKRVSDVSERTV